MFFTLQNYRTPVRPTPPPSPPLPALSPLHIKQTRGATANGREVARSRTCPRRQFTRLHPGIYTTGGQERWHEGFVIRYQTSTADGRARRSAQERYQIAYLDGMEEWVDELPEPGIAFRRCGGDARVSRAEVERAQRLHRMV